MKMKRCYLIGMGWFFLTMGLTGAAAHAGSNEITPFAGLKEEYTDNLFLSARDEVDDFISTLSAGLRYRYQDPRSDAGASVRLDSLYYRKETQLDAVDQAYSGRFSHQFTDRFSVGGNGSYVIDSRPDRDIDVSGLVLNTETRHREDGSLSAQYALTPITTGSGSYAFSRDTYEKTKTSDVDTQSVSFSLSHDLSRWVSLTTGILFAGVTRYTYDTAEFDSYSVTAGFRRQIKALWSLEVSLGGRLTRSRFDAFYKDSEAYGGVGAVSLNGRSEVAQYGISASRDISTAGTTTGVSERTSLTAHYHYRFTRGIVGLFSGGVYLNQADRNSLSRRKIDETTVSVHPGLRWEITPDLKLDVTYTYTSLDNSANHSSAERNGAFMALSYQFPIHP
jgi:hypothetical protein